MLKRTIPALCALAACAAPAPAHADTTVAPDPAAQQVTALNGTVVWVSGKFGDQKLLRRAADGTIAPVPGAPAAKAYRSIDLGLDASGELVLTYRRCATLSRCTDLRDDLQGHRRSFRGLAPARCLLTTAPALWRDFMAYGRECQTRSKTLDAARSGLFVKRAGQAPRRIPLPRDAARFNARQIQSVDLRGTQVAAIAADIYQYAFAASVNGRGLRSFLAGASEGDSNANTTGLALGAGGALWALTEAEHAGDPNQAIVYRQLGDCRQYESMANATPDDSGFRAIDVAVDGGTLYLVAPGTGVVTHELAPEHSC